MSFSDLLDSTAYGNAVSGNVITFDPAALTDVVAGDLVVLWWSVNSTGRTVSSCADDSGVQTYDITSCTPLSGGTNSTGWILCKAVSNDFGTLITITLDANASRRSGTLVAYHASNGNPVLEVATGAAADGASPCDTLFSGVLQYPDCMGMVGFGWRGGAVASGYVLTTPATGFTDAANPGLSGGATTRTEMQVSYDENLGSTATWQGICTFTSITTCHKWLLVFSDVGISPEVAQNTPRPRISLPRPSQVFSAFDSPTAPGAAAWAPASLSRARSPRPDIPSSVSAAAAAPISPPWAAVTQGRRVAAYRGSYSAISAAASDPVETDGGNFAQVILSRLVSRYRAARSEVVVPAGASVAPAGTFAPTILSRLVPRYRGSYSAVSAAAGAQVPATAGGWAPIIQSRGSLARVVRLSLVLEPLGDGTIVILPAPNSGGGGEWVIWHKPDFPGNRAGAFKRPTRRQQRGY